MGLFYSAWYNKTLRITSRWTGGHGTSATIPSKWENIGDPFGYEVPGAICIVSTSIKLVWYFRCNRAAAATSIPRARRALNRIRETTLLFAIPLLITLLSMGPTYRVPVASYVSRIDYVSLFLSLSLLLANPIIAFLFQCSLAAEVKSADTKSWWGAPGPSRESATATWASSRKRRTSTNYAREFSLCARTGDLFKRKTSVVIRRLYMFHEGAMSVRVTLTFRFLENSVTVFLLAFLFHFPLAPRGIFRHEKNAWSFLSLVALRINFKNVPERALSRNSLRSLIALIVTPGEKIRGAVIKECLPRLAIFVIVKKFLPAAVAHLKSALAPLSL